MTKRSRQCASMKKLLWDNSMFTQGNKHLTEEQHVTQEFLFVVAKCIGWNKYMWPTNPIPDDL